MKENIRIKKEISYIYDGTAIYYDETRFGNKSSFSRRRSGEKVEDILLKFLKDGPTLEIGTGTGRYPIFILKKSLSPFAVGIDLSRGMLRIAREKAKAEEIELPLFQMDAENLAFKPRFFTNVICILTLNFLPNYLESLKEICRVLKPEGRFILFYHSGDNFFRKVKSKIFKCDLPNGLIKHRTFKEINESLIKLGLNVIYRKDILNLPGFIYRIVPDKILNLKVLKWLDEILIRGWITIVVAEKGKKWENVI